MVLYRAMANDTMVGSAVSVAKRLGKSTARVYEAFLDPALARAWMGLGSDGVSELAIDARPGGKYRFVTQRGGVDIEHRGEYRELVPGKRLHLAGDDLLGKASLALQGALVAARRRPQDEARHRRAGDADRQHDRQYHPVRE